MLARSKKTLKNLAVSIIMVTFALAYRNNGVDPLAQLVEHNTFNVRVMGSRPMRVTKRES